MERCGEQKHIRYAVFVLAVCLLIGGPAGPAAQAAYVDVVDALNPLGYWRLGESSGTTATDRAGSYNGTYDTVTLGATGALAGDSDTAAAFDGSDSMVINIGPSADLLLTADLSVSFWFKPASFPTGNTPEALFTITADAATSGTAKLAELAIDKNGDIVYTHEYGNQGSSEQTYTFDVGLSTDTWYNIALIRDSGVGDRDVLLYVDNSLIDTYSYSQEAEGYTEGEMSIGGNTSTKFEGSIDEFAIFGSQLTSQDVTDIYNAAQVPEPATIVLMGLGTFLLRKKRYVHHAA